MIEALYAPLDLLFGWVSLLSPVVGMAVVGLISAVALSLVQKYGSRQSMLAKCKADQKRLKGRIREARRAGDRETAARLKGLSRRIGGKYAWGTLKPSFWSVPLITIVGLWAGARLGFEPIRPGGVAEVRAHFEDAAEGFAHVLPPPNVEVTGAGIVPIAVPAEEGAGRQARWTLRATAEGSEPLVVRHGTRTYEVALPVFSRGGRPPDEVTFFSEATPDQDRLQAVQFVLTPGIPDAWWSLWFGWMGLYIVVTVILAVVLRPALRIH